MKVLKEYIRYYISGSLRQVRENDISCQIKKLKNSQGTSENILRNYVRSIILQHINEVCGDVNDDVADALATAQMAHLGQKRRTGEPYLVHPVEVANIVYAYYPDEPVLCAAALLHDALEDALSQGNVKSSEEMESLIAGSFGQPDIGLRALDIVRSLTHTKGTDYSDYVASIANKPDVLKIKLSDMLHNLQSAPSPKQKQKYKDALDTLSLGGPPPGINPAHWKELVHLINKDSEELN